MEALRVPKTSIGNDVHAADWRKKRLVWVPSEQYGFEQASFVGEQEDKYIVELQSGKKVYRVFFLKRRIFG